MYELEIYTSLATRQRPPKTSPAIRLIGKSLARHGQHVHPSK